MRKMLLMTKHIPLVRLFLVLVVAATLGCVDRGVTDPGQPDSGMGKPDATDENACGIASNQHNLVVRHVTFAGEDEPGVTRGLNLDGRVSEPGDAETCGQQDFVGPDGTEGIDNQFAELLPALDLVASFDSVQALIDRTINSGGLLLTFEMNRVESFENDECVEFTFSRGAGVPTIGADGRIEAGQTIDRDESSEPVRVDSVTLADGRIVAGPIDLSIPFTVDTFDIQLTIRNATIDANFDPDGNLEGIIAGSIVIPEFVEAISDIEASADVLDLAARVLQNEADLARDESGQCQQISATLVFEAVPVFFFD